MSLWWKYEGNRSTNVEITFYFWREFNTMSVLFYASTFWGWFFKSSAIFTLFHAWEKGKIQCILGRRSYQFQKKWVGWLLPALETSLLIDWIWPIFTLDRMISGARYSGVPHRVHVRPLTRFAKPKSVIWEKINHNYYWMNDVRWFFISSSVHHHELDLRVGAIEEKAHYLQITLAVDK